MFKLDNFPVSKSYGEELLFITMKVYDGKLAKFSLRALSHAPFKFE